MSEKIIVMNVIGESDNSFYGRFVVEKSCELDFATELQKFYANFVARKFNHIMRFVL